MHVSMDMMRKYILAALRNCNSNDLGTQFHNVYLHHLITNNYLLVLTLFVFLSFKFT